MSDNEKYEKEYERLTSAMDDLIHQLRSFWDDKKNPIAPKLTGKITHMQQQLQDLLDDFNETSSM